MWICGEELYHFCNDYSPKILIWWIICVISSLVTFWGIIMHLLDLIYFRTWLKQENELKMGRELRYIRNHVKSVLNYDADAGLMFLNQTKSRSQDSLEEK